MMMMVTTLVVVLLIAIVVMLIFKRNFFFINNSGNDCENNAGKCVAFDECTSCNDLDNCKAKYSSFPCKQESGEEYKVCCPKEHLT